MESLKRNSNDLHFVVIDNSIWTMLEHDKDKERQSMIVAEIEKYQNPEILITPTLFLEFLNWGSLTKACSINTTQLVESLNSSASITKSTMNETRKYIKAFFKEKLTEQKIKEALIKKTTGEHKIIHCYEILQPIYDMANDFSSNSKECESMIDYWTLIFIALEISHELHAQNLKKTDIKIIFNNFVKHFEIKSCYQQNYAYDPEKLLLLIFSICAYINPPQWKLEKGKDFMDVELLHFALFGVPNYGELQSVVIITADNQMGYRIEKIIKTLREHYSELKLHLRIGKIRHFNKNSNKFEDVIIPLP